MRRVVDQKCDVFKIAKWMVKTNHDIVNGQNITNHDDDVLAVTNIDEKITWNTEFPISEKLLNTEFAWVRNNLSQTETTNKTIRCSVMNGKGIKKIRSGYNH